MAITQRTDVYKPVVNAENVMVALVKELNLLPFVKVETVLEGRAGDTINIPEWDFIGASSEPLDDNDGVDIDFKALSLQDQSATVKKTTIGIAISDEAIIGRDYLLQDIENQLATSIAETVEVEVVRMMNETDYVSVQATLSFDSLLKANNEFKPELSSRKVLFIHPDQYLDVTSDVNFIFAHEYENVSKGEIGALAGVHLVPSTSVDENSVQYLNNMICLSKTEQELAPVSIYLKRDMNIEVHRVKKNRTWEFSADIIFAVALTNPRKVIQVRHDK